MSLSDKGFFLITGEVDLHSPAWEGGLRAGKKLFIVFIILPFFTLP